MNPIIYLSLFGLLACNVYGRAIDESEPDNTISSETTFVEINEWVKVKPIKVHQHIGNTVELECDVIGSPPPSIHWVRGGKPIDNVSIFQFSLCSKFFSNFFFSINFMICLFDL